MTPLSRKGKKWQERIGYSERKLQAHNIVFLNCVFTNSLAKEILWGLSSSYSHLRVNNTIFVIDDHWRVILAEAFLCNTSSTMATTSWRERKNEILSMQGKSLLCLYSKVCIHSPHFCPWMPVFNGHHSQGQALVYIMAYVVCISSCTQSSNIFFSNRKNISLIPLGKAVSSCFIILFLIYKVVQSVASLALKIIKSINQVVASGILMNQKAMGQRKEKERDPW